MTGGGRDKPGEDSLNELFPLRGVADGNLVAPGDSSAARAGFFPRVESGRPEMRRKRNARVAGFMTIFRASARRL